MRYLYYRRVIFFLIFLLRLSTMSAQTYDYSMDYNKSSSPSGSNSFLNASANVSPSLYTGGLQLSLPIYTLKGIDLQVPITIDYTANNGVRPSDPNTCVGMDWMLTAGGKIARTVRGLPDESTYGYIGPNEQASIVAADYTSTNSLTRLNFNDVMNVAAGNKIVDGEPDLFTIMTPSFSVQFTLDQSGNPVFEGGKTGLQIIHHLVNNTAGGTYGFTVIDPQGTQYTFGTQAASREQTTTSFFGTSMPYISTWYLEKIVTLNSKDVVTFTYQEVGDEYVRSYELNKNYTATFPSSPWPATANPTSFSGVAVKNVIINTTYYNGPKLISSIVTKSGEADFTYTGNSVSYINNATPPALTAVTIKQYNAVTSNNSTVLETFNLSYSDIETGLSEQTQPYSDTAVWADYYRRTLNTITVTGNTSATSTPLTLFNLIYYQSLPFCDHYLVQNWDYWGYQNSTTWLTDADNEDENWFIYPDTYRQPASYVPAGTSSSVPMAAIFALQELDQLGGSKTMFNYQQNDYYNGSANVPAGGARLGSITRQLPTGETLTTTYSYYDANNHSTGQLWSDLYRHVVFYYGPCCSVPAVSTSQSPFSFADNKGVMVGYSSVKVTDPNGGSTVSSYYNFSDYPDVIQPLAFVAPSFVYDNSSVCENLSSFSYKRGLVKSTTTYNASGAAITQDQYFYGSADVGNPPPVVKAIGMQDMTWLASAPYYAVNIYNSNIEDWRVTQAIHTDYDQLSPTTRSLQTTTALAYSDARKVRSQTTTDSKGQSHVTTYYYADDGASIPFVTSAETSALSALASTSINATDLLINRADSRNGTVRQLHNIYGAFQLGFGTNYYLASSTQYTGNTAELQQFNNYNISSSLPISSDLTGGKYTSASYGYNSVYPIVKIVNAANTASYSSTPTSLAGNYFAFSSSTWNGQQQQFTTTSAGTFSITLAQGVSGANETFSFNLVGVTTGGVCMNSGSSTSCQFNSTYTWTANLPAGTYTLIVTPGNPSSAPTNGASIYVTYSVLGYSITPSGSTEYFFEGFEQNSAAIAGSAHTGNMYYNGSYTVPYTPPNSRQYVIQWWNLSGGQWIFNQMPYSANMVLSGPLDDVRVFPIDALMTTYTYSPMIGKTSETDPSGKTINYKYDGLGRLSQVLDQDGNIVKQMDYEYQVGLQQ